MKRNHAPGELELLVLTQLEKLGEASVKDLEKQLNQKYAYTTLMTVLTRLYLKKKIQRKKIGRQFIYFVKKNPMPSLLKRLIDKVFSGKKAGLIQYLIDSSESLSEKEIEEIEKALKRCKND